MHRVRLQDAADLAVWREAARVLWQAGVPPEQVHWQFGPVDGLFAEPTAWPPPQRDVPSLRVSREFMQLADGVLAHRDPQRHGRLYRLLWRIGHGERRLLRLLTDDEVAWALACAQAVRRDMHKMKAFVRFRRIDDESGSWFVAWFEPEHDIVTRVAPFFVRRFAGMRWSILTPLRSAHWDGAQLQLAGGARRSEAPEEDALEALWRTYYANIFNPARLKLQAMRSEMPQKYWKNLPEARLIPGLVSEALPRLQAMVAAAPSLPKRWADHARPLALPLPPASTTTSLPLLADELRRCRACPLWQPATQAIAGAGPRDARIMLLGDQPGDHEDLAGLPFAGPSGPWLDRALAELGLDRRAMYVTHAVKHFKFEPRGRDRLPARADAAEQRACRHWLQAELALLRPRVVVCLGTMAAQALLGPAFRLSAQRGQWQRLADGTQVLPTVSPCYLMRQPAARREAAYRAWLDDLRRLRDVVMD